MHTAKEAVAELLVKLHAPRNIWCEESLFPCLKVTCPADGSLIAVLEQDNSASVGAKIAAAREAHVRWAALPRAARQAVMEQISAALKDARLLLARLIMYEAGKTEKEGLGEADGSADILLKTIKDAQLADFSGMRRVKERPPVGVVGLITSFNFPLVVAHWTLAPALLAGNSVVWKPSEKTPLSALATKAIFDKAAGEWKELLQIIIGGRDVGEAMVADERVDIISATGSVAMGKGIKQTLAGKRNNAAPPILELGGNNGMIISNRLSGAHLEFVVSSLLHSYFGTSGQRCTNTRRLFVHQSLYNDVVRLLTAQMERFVAEHPVQSPLSGVSNDYGYGPLIDADAFARFEKAKQNVLGGGGKIMMGSRLPSESDAYYVEPALALLSEQTEIMHEEIFAPLLFAVPYKGTIENAVALLNAPENSGLVGALYTQSQKEADYFAAHTDAGHCVINSSKGTGTPAFGMGFGGNKASGEGEILNAADPLRPFTRADAYRRIAQNADILMDQD